MGDWRGDCCALALRMRHEVNARLRRSNDASAAELVCEGFCRTSFSCALAQHRHTPEAEGKVGSIFRRELIHGIDPAVSCTGGNDWASAFDLSPRSAHQYRQMGQLSGVGIERRRRRALLLCDQWISDQLQPRPQPLAGCRRTSGLRQIAFHQDLLAVLAAVRHRVCHSAADLGTPLPPG